MPLSDPAQGHIGRNGRVEEPKEGSQEELPRSKTPNIGGQSSFPQTPSSIQSMLKNTTETGDVGQFSIKPARVPSMIHRASKSPNTNQPILTKRRHNGGPIHEQKDGRQTSMYPSGSSASMVSTSYNSHQQSSYRNAHRRSAGEEEDERSYSMTQCSITSQSFSNHPSHTDFQLHHPGEFRGVRPRSPFAYPTRLKRPGYRPTSPALSDFNRPMPGAYTAPSRTASFRTASPLSISTPNRVPPMWQQSVNRSDPMLRYYAQSPRQEDFRESLPTSARGPLSQLPNGLVSIRSITPTQFSDISVSRRTSPSPSPVFYDYAESFEENQYHSVSRSSFSVAEQVIQEDVPKVYHELDGEVASQHITELPADSTHPHKYELELTVQPLSTTKVTRKAEPIFQPPAKQVEKSEVPIARGKEPSPHAKDLDGRHKMENEAIHMDHIEPPAHGRTPESRLTPVEKSGLESIPPPRSSQHLVASNASLESVPPTSSSPIDPTYSLRSSSQNNRQTPVPGSTEPSETMSPTGPYLEIPSTQSRKSDAPIRDIKPPVGFIPRGTSFDGKSDTTEHSEIYAPTPERAASSLSNRKRFSRILSLDDALANVESFASKAEMAADSRSKNSIEENPVIDYSAIKCRFGRGNGRSTDVSHSEGKVAQPTIHGKVPESRIGTSEMSKKSLNILAPQIPRRNSSRSLNTSISGISAEPTIPPRRSSCIRKPAYNLFEQKASKPLLGLPLVTEGFGRSTAPTETVSSKTINVHRTMKELPPLPGEPALVAYSPPIDRTPPTLPFAFTPLIAPQEDEIPTIDVECQSPPVYQQNADNPTAPAELPAMANPKKSIDLSTTRVGTNPVFDPEQGDVPQGTQSEPTDVAHGKQRLDLQTDSTDTLHVQQQIFLPALQPDATIEHLPDQNPAMPTTQLEPRRISYSAISSSRLSESDGEEQAPIPKYKLKMRTDRDSPPRPQPWNLDDSYPWTSHSPKLEVTMPQQSEDPPAQTSGAIPRFKLKIQRASSSTAGTTKISKQRRSAESPLPARINVSNDLFRPSPFGRQPRPSITIGQENSSQSPHLQTRFKESFEQPPTTFAISPTITLVPPSPGLNLEARSFFSDDSSQVRSRSSLRKRLSQLRAMASRNTMSEDGRSYDRAILRSRASGRISKQSVRTAENVSNFKSMRSKVAEKVKRWLLRGGEKFRGLWRRESESGHAGPHTGV